MKSKYINNTNKLFRKIFNTSLFVLLPLAGSAWAAEEPVTPLVVDGGIVNFNGSIVSASCAVSATSANMNVDMGQIRAASLSEAGGEASTAKAFSIGLEDCDNSIYTGVAVTFSGTPDANDTGALAVGFNGGAGSAQNVAIRLYDEQGKQVKLDTASDVTMLRNGDNTLNFSAKYVSPLGGATAGNASALATYTLTYS